jgi:hypothetical protein
MSAIDYYYLEGCHGCEAFERTGAWSTWLERDDLHPMRKIEVCRTQLRSEKKTEEEEVTEKATEVLAQLEEWGVTGVPALVVHAERGDAVAVYPHSLSSPKVVDDFRTWLSSAPVQHTLHPSDDDLLRRWLLSSLPRRQAPLLIMIQMSMDDRDRERVRVQETPLQTLVGVHGVHVLQVTRSSLLLSLKQAQLPFNKTSTSSAAALLLTDDTAGVDGLGSTRRAPPRLTWMSQTVSESDTALLSSVIETVYAR